MASIFLSVRKFGRQLRRNIARVPSNWHKVKQFLYVYGIKFNCRGRSKLWEENTLLSIVSPWHRYPYDHQLKIKQEFLRRNLTKLGYKVSRNTRNAPQAFLERLTAFDGLPCPLEPIIPSPIANGYRNKSRMVLSAGYDGKPTAGFYIPPGAFPAMPVSNSLRVPSQNPLHYEIGRSFQEHVSNSSIPSLGALTNCGPHWKNIEVRTNRKQDVAVGIIIDSNKAPQAFMDKVREDCINFFTQGGGSQFNVKSLHLMDCPYQNCDHGQAFYEHIHGEKAITETMHGCKFNIIPGNFFQINVWAAEILYEQIGHLAGFTKDSVLLDLCCGSGIIGIIMSKFVKKVYGIELLQSSIDAAKESAEINGVTNIDYIQGKVEKRLKYITKILHGEDVIAVVNPARGGLKSVVMDEIRNCESIKRVLYVSCKPYGRPLFNIMRLCQTHEKLHGKPFIVQRAISVDMFPHTRHYEVIFLLER